MGKRDGAEEALQSIAWAILARAARAIEDRSLSEAVAVHEFRKVMKRWRALLRLLEPFLGRKGRKLRAEARDLARALSGPRDAQSAIDAFNDAFKHNTRISPQSLASVRTKLEQARQRSETTILTDEMRDRIETGLRAAARSVERWPHQRIEASDISGQLSETYRRARRRIPDDWESAAPEDLHRLRQRVIELRYQLELVEPIFPNTGKPRIDDLQKLRDRLGRYQDLVLLGNLLGPKEILAPWRSRLAPFITDRQAVHLAAAARLGERLFADRPKAIRRRLHEVRAAGST
ncbi:MAG: CHAD domain-containing protein [Bradyrhizobiaceae bacterium]|nr:CHAD domain-containing protein [Bradyrhizobiaceae bacterium]